MDMTTAILNGKCTYIKQHKEYVARSREGLAGKIKKSIGLSSE